MTTAAYHPVGGLQALEAGLQNLRRSRLMIVHEFKTMFWAIEQHHRDLKLAHLTGKAKDLQDQGIRDTKFYNILVKMLCEIKEKRTGEQREGLKRVHTWYLANKHVLYCGPRFGKEHLKEEAKEILRKATSPREHKRAKSAKERPLSNKITSSRSGGRYKGTGLSATGQPRLYNSYQNTPRNNSAAADLPSFRLDFERKDGYNQRALDSPEIDEFDLQLQLAANDEEIIALRNGGGEGKSDHSGDEGPVGHSASPSPTRMLSRPKTAASVTFAHLKEQKQASSPRSFPKKSVHPISSMVNPHTALAKELAPVDPSEATEDRKADVVSVRIRSAPASRTDNLQAWQVYNKNRSYGQDVVGKLSFAGRSGTGSDIRYSAHGQGENPEMHTKDMVKHFAQHISSPALSPSSMEDDSNIFVQQTLEEFYMTADAMKPTSRATPRKSVHARAKSASSAGKIMPSTAVSQSNITKQVKDPQRLGHPLEDPVKPAMPETEEPPPDTGVKLDTVINVIDSVTEEMAYFREKLTPDPQPGFRQPSTSGLPTPRETSIGNAGDGSRSPLCPTPVSPRKANDDKERRPASSSLMRSRTVIIKEDVENGVKRAKMRCRSAGIVDWRGKIQPETMRYKWSKTKYGGHTYLKKWNRSNLRSAGSTSAGKRPKTAPTTAKEKWKTEKANERNVRAVQAASHSTMVVDQGDVDNMVTVQHLLSGEDRADSMGSLLDFDESFWRSLGKSTSNLRLETPNVEFLSFVTPTAAALADHRLGVSQGFREEGDGDLSVLEPSGGAFYQEEEQLGTGRDPAHRDVISPTVPAEIRVPHSSYDTAVKEDPDQLRTVNHTDRSDRSDRNQLPTGELAATDEGAVHPCETRPTTERSYVQISSAVSPSGQQGPTPSHLRTNPIQSLSKSDQWQLSTAEDFCESEGIPKKGDHFCDVHLIPEQYCSECRPQMMSTRVERSAGRMPSSTHSTNSQMLAFSRRYSEALRRAPPLRTPPSIPTPQTSAKKQSRGGQMLLELEHHARRSRSPRSLMHKAASTPVKKKLQTLRSVESSRPGSMATTFSNDSIMGTSLQVCKLPVSSRGRMSQMSSEYDFDFQNPQLKNPMDTSLYLSREQSSLHAIDEGRDAFSTDKQVMFSDVRHHFPSKPMTAPAVGSYGSLDRLDQLGLQRNATFTSIGSKPSGGRTGTITDVHSSRTSRSLAKRGRPIAQVSQVPDPDELFQAVRVQKEAAAAVDIQRIFRGYVARNVYKSLLSEERWKKEEERKAAIKIQSSYRGHISRKNNIYNRPPLNPELVHWAKDVKTIQSENASRRQVKMNKLSNEISSNRRESNGKIATIGPHVEIYDIYHPKKTGPTKKELNLAAIKIQKVVRGWVIRRKMEKLARKATWYGSTFHKMVKEYKTMLKRVQQQHGVDKAKTPFSIKDMNDYIDIRRRYESVFEKKAFGGELEQGDIEAFFKECDLYPSQAEIEEAMDVTLHGQANKRENKGMKKKELMDMIFYIYVPPATQLGNTRQSTWMSPIIHGEEARKLIGSEFVETAPLAPCMKLVIDTRRGQRLKEQAEKDMAQKKRQTEAKQGKEEEKKDVKKSKKVTLHPPDEG